MTEPTTASGLPALVMDGDQITIQWSGELRTVVVCCNTPVTLRDLTAAEREEMAAREFPDCGECLTENDLVHDGECPQVMGLLAAAAPHLAAFPRCPTPCDDDCEAACHEVHDVPSHREHVPEVCVGTIMAAAAATERRRIAAWLEAEAPRYTPGQTAIRHVASLLWDQA